jgi:copper chaperone NosL
MRRGRVIVLFVAFAAACGGGPRGPAELDTRHDNCRFCRMTVSDRRFAAQIVAPGEEALFFDDLGCVTSYLKDAKAAGTGSVLYVSDHRTREWVPAATAVFTRVEGLETPMGSGMVAHRDAASRAADAGLRPGVPVPLGEIVPPGSLPGGVR